MNQDYNFVSVRAAAVLTTGYVAATVIGPDNMNPALRNQITLLIDYTTGSGTSLDVKVEYAHDGSTPDYYQETFESISTGTATMSLGVYNFAATGKYTLSIPVKAAYVKVSVKGNGVDQTGSSCKIGAIVGTV